MVLCIMNRRSFVKNTGLATAGFAMLPNTVLPAANQQKVKLGFIGVGLRGQNHLDNALRRKDVDVIAVCDIDSRMLQMTSDLFKKHGKPQPKVYTGDPYAWKKMV